MFMVDNVSKICLTMIAISLTQSCLAMTQYRLKLYIVTAIKSVLQIKSRTSHFSTALHSLSIMGHDKKKRVCIHIAKDQL